MDNAINRAFKISDGLTRIAGNKIKAAVAELKKEGVITPAESSKILKQMSKVKKNIYDSVTRELKAVINKTSKSGGKKSSKKK